MPEQHDRPSRFAYLHGRKTLVGALHVIYGPNEEDQPPTPYQLLSAQRRSAAAETPAPHESSVTPGYEATPPAPIRRSTKGRGPRYKRAQPHRNGMRYR